MCSYKRLEKTEGKHETFFLKFLLDNCWRALFILSFFKARLLQTGFIFVIGKENKLFFKKLMYSFFEFPEILSETENTDEVKSISEN